MESSQPAPENNPQKGTESVSKKRGLRAWLLRNTETPFSSVEQDDDEESTDKPKKKFRKFFKGLFKNIVESPEAENSEDHKRPSLESLFFGWEDYDKAPKTSPEPQLDAPEATSVGLEERTTEEVPSAPLQAETSSSAPEDTPEAAVEDEAQELVRPQETVTPIERTSEWQHVVERPDKTVIEKETVVERGPGMALPIVLVGAEYLARKKADRKLEGRVNEKIEAVEKDVVAKELARTQLETLVKQNKEQLEILKRGRSNIIEKAPARPEKTEVKQEKTHVRQEVAKPQPEHLYTEVKQPEELDKREQYKIMEQVADAAEQNRPVEIAFERSHEVKDDVSIPSSAASIGAIMAEQAAEKQRIAQAQALQRQMGDTSTGLPVFSDAPSKDLYKQAMKSGFWAAVAIIILGLLAYLVK